MCIYFCFHPNNKGVLSTHNSHMSGLLCRHGMCNSLWRLDGLNIKYTETCSPPGYEQWMENAKKNWIISVQKRDTCFGLHFLKVIRCLKLIKMAHFRPNDAWYGYNGISLTTGFIGPPWGPPGSCRPQVSPMLTTWNLLSGMISWYLPTFSAIWGRVCCINL